MSVFTKIFVVLLVICSLLLSAATVVFVNRVDDFKKQYESNSGEVKAVKKLNDELKVALEESGKAKQAIADAAVTDLKAKDVIIAGAATKLTEQQALYATALKDKDAAMAANVGVADALRASVAQVDDLQKLVTDIRGKYDGVIGQFRDLNVALTVASSKIGSLTKALEFEQEHSEALAARVKQLEGSVASNKPMTSDAGTGPTPNGGTAALPDIKGVVREVSMISGKKYATISVGSSSGVSKGMRFTAINRQTGEFLGYVTIDNVQPDEAIGQVEGPKVEKVQANIDVRTQL